MRKTIPLHSWAFNTVEWSPKLSKVIRAKKIRSTHFVLPDLPGIISQKGKDEYFQTIPYHQRIQTIASCQYNDASVLCADVRAGKVLVVGGNSKNERKGENFSTLQVAEILQNEIPMDVEIWGVTNPNEKESCKAVDEKIDSGITGFITQPLLSSHAMDVLESYPKSTRGGVCITYIAGLALPLTSRDLYFWLKLLEQPELEGNSLFKSHMTYFQKLGSPVAWAKREVLDLQLRSAVNGIHIMPLRNIDLLLKLL